MDFTYTCTFFSCTEALASSAGKTTTETAASALTTSATVVKKPNTDWMRFKEECMVCWEWEDEASWACLDGSYR
jgi:hypothetical protein